MRAGDLLGGRFRIERLERAGGMGSIFKSRDETNGQLVAVKTMDRGTPPPSVDQTTELGARFIREAETLERLEHPSIVRYIAHGSMDDGSSYIAMEWLDGETLGARVARGPLSPHDALIIGLQIAQALAYAHERGIVHRDVKPGNIMLCDWRLDRTKLLDFGVARVSSIASELTGTGSMLGTPGYMSPEQARGEKPLGPRTDVFALGCVLFAAIAGAPPYVADSVAGVLARLLEHDAPHLRTVVATAPESVDDLLFRMMARAPASRPQDGAAVSQAIAAILPSVPRTASSTAPPPSVALSVRERVVATVIAIGAEPGDRFRVEAALEPLGMVAITAPGYFFVPIFRLGAPHDHATFAARVALSLADGMPEAPIGVATGWLEIDATGDARGDALERARVSAQTAESIILDDATAALLDRRFVVRARALEGRRDESAIDTPGVSPLDRLFLRGPAGAAWPLVGRTREIAQLRSLLDECIQEPIARVALLVGEAGVGKTRVLREFLSSVGTEVSLLVSTCERAHAGHPFAALPTLTTSGATKRGPALEARIASGLEKGPVVVVVDDAQWGDDPSFRLLLAAAKKHATAPLLVLLCGRPSAKDAFFALGGRGAIAQEVLVTAPSRKLLDQIAAQAKLPEAAAANATTPLELAAIAASPAPWSRMWRQARLDALEPPLRRVLRACAMCDEPWGERAVVSHLGAADETMAIRNTLDALSAMDILVREGTALRFANVSLRDAARGMLADGDTER